MNSLPDSRPPKRHPRRRRFAAYLLQAVRHSSSWILRLIFSFAIVVVGLFAYLHLVGLPAYFTDYFLDRMAADGYYLQIERLALEIDRGLVAKNIRLFPAADAAEPFMEARELTVALDPLALLHGHRTTLLSIVDGSLRVHLGDNRPGLREGWRSLAAGKIHLRLSSSGQVVVLREFAADALNIRFRGRGALYLPETPVLRRVPTNPLAVMLAAIENAPAAVPQALEQLNAVAFNETPTADFSFVLYPARPAASQMSIRLNHAAGGAVRGVDFRQLAVDAEWKDQRLQVANLQVGTTDGTLGLWGEIDWASRSVAMHLLNTLPPATFLKLLPQDLQIQAAGMAADYRFPLRLELQIGPCALAAAAEHLSGRLSFADAVVREVPIVNFDATFAREGPEVRIENGTIQLGRGPLASRLAISAGRFHLANRQFRARVAGTLDPNVLAPMMTTAMRNIVGWFGVREPLQGDVVLGGTLGNPAIYCYGPVTATNFTIHGAEVQSIAGDLLVTNEVMHLTRAVLSRPEGLVRGDMHLAFSNQMLRLDNVDSTIDLRAAAQMIGPATAAFMQPFRIEGPIHLRGAGELDWCNFALNQLQIGVAAQRFGYDRWIADETTFDLAVVGLRFRITNANAKAYGGEFAGSGTLYPVGGDAHWRYEAEVDATDVNLAALLTASFAPTNLPTESTTAPVPDNFGKLSGTLLGAIRVGGYFGRGEGTNVAGQARFEIRNGMLFRTKLLNYLSAILGKILPDFNLFAQTDARGDFTIRNGRLYSRNVQLQGTLFSIKAAGNYGFAGDLDYKVEVQLLRGGPVATLVRLATLPVTRLLEFRLTGTFDEPRWRPSNLNPAELFTGGTKSPDGVAP